MGRPRLTTEDWIQRAIERWGDKYDYSRAVYVNRSTSVEILCPVHGAVWVNPEYHIRKVEGNTGCTKCGKSNTNKDRRILFEEFVMRSRMMFGEKYSYDESSYREFTDYISYVCPFHGPQRQKGHVHLSSRINNQGCGKCGREHANQSLRITFEEFIRRSNLIHNHKYSYHKDGYRGARTPTRITCPAPQHDDFFQQPCSHFNGAGCPECAGVKKLNTSTFIERSKQVHGDRFCYESVDYINSDTRVLITCKIHGDFPVLPMNHLHAASGCPACAYAFKGLDSLPSFASNPEWASSECEVYIAKIKGKDWIKIGISNNADKRDPLYVDVITETASRSECWCVEQYLLISTLNSAVRVLPDEFLEWRGRNELRHSSSINLSDLRAEMLEQLALAKRLGWSSYANLQLIPKMGIGWSGSSVS